MGEQASLGSLFCTATSNDNALEPLAGAIWIVLALSWTAGLLALRRAALGPIYWSLLAAIPLALGAQSWLIRRAILSCDSP